MSKNPPYSSSNNATPPSVLPSCLRTRPDSTRRNLSLSVSFPEEECNLITGFLEPANPWEYAENVNHEEIISSYVTSCEKHGTNPLPLVVEQLKTLDIQASRNDCLDLKGAPLAALACEALEEILKRVQFKNINLETTALDDEGSVALFDMIEYYESATHLNISGNREIAGRGWQACSRMIKKTRCLEQLEARNVTLNEQYMPILSRALKLGTQLQVLKLENCGLSGRPVIILAAALKLNTSLKELYLADNNLNVSDAILLGAVLQSNQILQLLDVSNNQIQDAGVGHILDGLVEQAPQISGTVNNGLCILILWNNHLTRNSAKHLARALARSTSLEILNVGHNVLTNECLHVMKDSLQQNRTLLRLGMQSTHLTCEGAIALAECIADNPVIQRIDLRDNNLQVAGLMALSLSMKVNRSVNQLDLDDTPKKKLENGEVLKQYISLVSEIRGYCIRNEQADFSEDEPSTPEDSDSLSERTLRVPSSMASRKISLTCETLMRSVDPENSNSQFLEPRRVTGGRLRSPAPSPVPSPVSSPIPSPSRTRFQVSRVSEPQPVGSPSSCSSSPFTPPSISPSPTRFFASPTTSRFRVTLVEPSSIPVTQPIVSSPSGNNITVGFTFKLNDKNISPKISPESSNSVSPTVANELNTSSTAVSKLSESLAAVDIRVQNEEGKVCSNKQGGSVLIKELEDTPNSLSTSLSSLDESADLEVRQILDSHDQKVCNSKNVENTSEHEKEKMLGEQTTEQNKVVKSSDVIQASTSEKPCDKNIATISSQKQICDKKVGLHSVHKENVIPSSSFSVAKSERTPCGGNLTEASESSSTVAKSSKCVNQRQRKISWIAPVHPPAPEQKPPSSLEKLLGLFQHPASFFSKAQPQYKATTVIVNQQPVANSNASFLLTAGPLAGAALEARLRGVNVPSPDPLEDDKEQHPAVDVLNNNNSEISAHSSSSNSSSDGSSSSSEGSGGSSSSGSNNSSSCSSGGSSSNSKSSQSLNEGTRRMCSQCTVEQESVRIRTEDENFNVSKHSSGSDVSSGTVDKLWCATLSSVCGANVVLPWAQSSIPSGSKCCGNDSGNVGTYSDATSLSDEPAVSALKKEADKENSASRLYTNVMKGAPANGMNVSLNASSLWSPNREIKENSTSLLPVTGVRLVGGGDPCPDGGRTDSTADGGDPCVQKEEEGADSTQLMIAGNIEKEESSSADV
ncbi:hypothetical protein R5R35_014432 [Gryllus longicercus]|uniref:Protein phosphatase 1 regulatory subunit 37 n=1 Tax=Gryllus longicercus TaxID=2509291 RepID=A0AAN9WAW0_9ORTH